MSRLDEKFKQLKSEGKKAFIPFLTAGFPDLDTSLDLIKVLNQAGADIIELGIPYADSLADGPVIQRASEISLQQGTKVKDVFSLVAKAKEEIDTPIVLLVYYNVIYRYGLLKFLEEASQAGVTGLVVPDLPAEEGEILQGEAKKVGIDIILLVALTSTPERIKMIASRAQGFIYGVSITGVTGARKELNQGLEAWVEKLHTYTDKPIAIGFGISTPEQAKTVAQIAEGVIVGSAIVKLVDQYRNEENLLTVVKDFVSQLNKATKD